MTDQAAGPLGQLLQRCLWFDQLDATVVPRPGLLGTTHADVVIVGAGLTGLWTAYYLALERPDLQIVVVEREVAGFGASGRNGGWANAGIAGSASLYARRSGPAAVHAAEIETNHAVSEIGAVINRHGITCDYNKGGSLAVAMTEPQLQRLQAEYGAKQRLNPEATDLQWLNRDQVKERVNIPDVRAGLFTPHAARIQPAKLVRELALVVEQMGVQIAENTAVTGVRSGVVETDGGSLASPVVILATEAYTTQLPGRHRRYLPLTSLMVATEPLPPDVWNSLGWPAGMTIRDKRHLFFYAQRTADGRIAIGGRGAPYRLGSPIDSENEVSAEVADRLQQTLRQHFPQTAEARVTHHWGGPLGVPRDWCMSVGYDTSTKIGWAGGYSGHGVTATNIAGRTLRDLVLNRSTALTKLPWVAHRARGWEPEPLRWLASNSIVRVLGSADRKEDRTDRPARRVATVAPFLPPS
ncbi:NAD(P)/FAD-dependent oxidoreductase [Streptomyces sp. NPDC091280]|uniref:NAD(P)/FAD-dependent oxidoreductase n=1 Tax=Streptomyces sp. NPDC091280 TaxID=3365984 RepID=UPI0037F6D5FF